MCSTAEIGFSLPDSEFHEREAKFNITQHPLIQMMQKDTDCGNKTMEKRGRGKKGVSRDYTGSGTILSSLWLKMGGSSTIKWLCARIWVYSSAHISHHNFPLSQSLVRGMS
jgi:hypothetical protein